MKTRLDSAEFAAIRTLVAAVDSGSLAEAARTLHLTPSAVSKQISRLEDAFSTRLLERTTRCVRPTAAGRALVERAKPLIDAFDETGSMLRDLDSEPRGRVRMTASRALGRLFLLPTLARLASGYPHLRVQLLLDAKRLDFVEDGVDLAVREGELPDSSLIATRLGNVRVGLFASAPYLKKRGAPRTVAELEQHDLLTLPLEDLSRTSLLRRSGVRVTPRFEINDLAALAELAAHGAGIAALPEYVADMQARALVRVLPRTVVTTFPVHLVYASRQHVPERVRVVIEALKQDLPGLLEPSRKSRGRS